jgi:hypothetical protein
MVGRGRSDEEYALVRSRLGERGEARLRRFIDYVCPLAVDAMLDFIANHAFPTTPSLFIVDDSRLQLIWEDSMGSQVGVDFSPVPVFWPNGAWK